MFITEWIRVIHDQRETRRKLATFQSHNPSRAMQNNSIFTAKNPEAMI